MSQAALNEINLTLNPGQTKTQDFAGGFLLVQAATQSFSLQFDASSPMVVKQGFLFTQSYTKLTIVNTSLTTPISITMFVGTAQVNFVASTNFQEAPTYPKGNMGCSSQAGITALSKGTLSTITNFPNQGTGYLIGDVLTLQGGTFSTAATIQVTAINILGGITSAVIANSGLYTVFPGSPASLSGGNGSGATVTFTGQAVTTGLSYDGANNALVVTTTSNTVLNNFDGANRRKWLVFTVLNVLTGGKPSSSLIVLDANGNPFMTIPPGGTIGIATSAQFILLSLGEGAGSTNCEFQLGEIYYSA